METKNPGGREDQCNSPEGTLSLPPDNPENAYLSTTRKELPCSFAQERRWFLEQLEPGSTVYKVPGTLHIRGPLKVAALEQSLNEIIRRHETLRTTFSLREGNPVQIISSSSNLSLFVVDLTDSSNGEEKARRLARDAVQQPFDLAEGPLLRATLLRLGKDDHVLLVNLHHIISDPWSMEVLYRELSIIYEAFSNAQPSPLPDLPLQYGDFAVWQRERLHGEFLEAQLSYWKNQLKDVAPLQFPTDHARPSVQRLRGGKHTVVLSKELTQGLKGLSGKEGVTLFMTLLAAFQTLLHRYSGQNAIVVGSPIAGRTRSEFEELIGVFVNTLVLRTNLSGNPTFHEVLARVREMVLGAYAHQDMPFEKLLEALHPVRSLNRSPLFQVMFVFESAPEETVKFKGLNVSPIWVDSETAEFDLLLRMSESGQGIKASLEYNTDLFEASTIERMLGHFQVLLKGIVNNSEVPIGRLPLLTEAEQHQLVIEWNDTRTDYPRNKRIHQLFEEQVERTADATAVVFEDQKLTYRELNARANQLGRYLRGLGVGPETFVGICVKRSCEMVVGILGILKAGGAYVPLDPEYPKERLAFMLEDTQAPMLLTQQPLIEHLPEHSARLVCLDKDWEDLAKENDGNLDNCATTGNLAYVIYTSGSTGKPKGVLVAHQGLCNLAEEQVRCFGVNSASRVLQFASVSFDASIFEIVMALIAGGTLYIGTPETPLVGSALAEFIRRHEITIATLPPSVLATMPPQHMPSLASLCVAGEACPQKLVTQWSSGRRFFNLYGPTEATVWTAVAECDSREERVSIGRPISNTQIFILDRHLNPVPIGVPGEILIGGVGLARGYLNRPELTAERFIMHSFDGKPAQCLYKTGDLARYRTDGNIEFLGRIDDQVKIHGYRIEPAEIEAALNLHPGVQESVVAAKQDKRGDNYLAAYIVPRQQLEITASDFTRAGLQNEYIANWEKLFEEVFTNAREAEDPTTNTAGVDSSYTSAPVPAAESRDWVEHAAKRVLSLKPNRVLDIGCGLGRTLFRVAPHCSQYWGTDISQGALDYVERHLDLLENKRGVVKLIRAKADDFGDIPKRQFDTVVINGVIQYFPHVDHLVKVLEKALDTVEPGGAIFIGDVRSLPLLDAFQLSVDLYHAPDDLPTDLLWQRVRRNIAQDEELVIDPIFFEVLAQSLGRISSVDILLKRGWAQNELTRFRYDVIFYVESHIETSPNIPWLDWVRDKLTFALLRERLADQPEALGISCVPNARVLPEVRASASLAESDSSATAIELRSAIESMRETAFHPEVFWSFEDDLPYSVDITWSYTGRPEFFDVLLKRRNSIGARRPPANFPEKTINPVPWRNYAHNPIDVKLSRALRTSLRTLLGQKLPSHMIPSAFMFLDSLPLSPNGKIDRNRLPPPDPTGFVLERNIVLPETSTEEVLAQIWATILGLEHQVGIHANFFDLGGHSLLATQIVSRVREKFQVELPLRTLFDQPTIAGLARVITQMQTARTEHPDVSRIPALPRGVMN